MRQRIIGLRYQIMSVAAHGNLRKVRYHNDLMGFCQIAKNGTKCTSYGECADIIIAGGVADYDGVSGPITFNEVGDPTQASIGIFQYGDDNNYSFLNVG